MLFPCDIAPPPPRSLVERIFDLRAWDVQPDGGRFGAWERPTQYVSVMRAALRFWS